MAIIIPLFKKNEIHFVLPLLPHNATENTIPENVYFYCLKNVKDSTLGFMNENNEIILHGPCYHQ